METNSPVLLDKAFVGPLIKKRKPASHKGDHGHALLIAGSKGKMGAAVIAATACLRSGAGLVTLNVPEEERMIPQVAIPEAMLMMRQEGGNLSVFSATGIGPGIGLDTSSAELLENLLENNDQRPLLLDADALTLLSKNKSLWGMLPAGTILTPHPGEFDRLFGKHATVEERNQEAIRLSLDYPWVIVLKGQATQITYKGESWINTTGNAGLAKGGSGDALTGVTLSFLAQGYEPLHAAIIAVYLHGLAADEALKEQSVESLLITDIFQYIGKAFTATV